MSVLFDDLKVTAVRAIGMSSRGGATVVPTASALPAFLIHFADYRHDKILISSLLGLGYAPARGRAW